MGHHDENTAPVNQGQNKKNDIVKVNTTELHTPNKILEGMAPGDMVRFKADGLVKIYYAGLPVSTWQNQSAYSPNPGHKNVLFFNVMEAKQYLRFDFSNSPGMETKIKAIVEKMPIGDVEMKSQTYKVVAPGQGKNPGQNKVPYCEFWPVFEPAIPNPSAMPFDPTMIDKIRFLNINKSLKAIDVDGKVTKVDFAVYNPETGEEYTQYFGAHEIPNPSNNFTTTPYQSSVSNPSIIYNGKTFAANQLWNNQSNPGGMPNLTYGAVVPKGKDFMVKFSVHDNSSGVTERKILVKADGSIINKTTP